ncbi:MAG: hypothetical protein ABIB46_01365 [bacterium]
MTIIQEQLFLLKLHFRKCFFDIYDNLGTSICFNFFWSFLFFPCFFLLLLNKNILLKTTNFLLIEYPITGILFYNIRLLIKEEKNIQIKFFIENFKKYFWKSIFLFLIYFFAFFLFKINFQFFQTSVGINKFISIINLFVICFFIFIQNYTFPLMTLNFTMKNIFKYAIYLSLNNFFFTFCIWMQNVAILLFTSFTVLGLLLIGISIVVISQLNSLAILLNKYQNISYLEEKYYRKIKELWKPWGKQ